MEEYKNKLQQAGFKNVTVTVTKSHEINLDIAKSSIGDLTEEEIQEIEGLSASAIVTAEK